MEIGVLDLKMDVCLIVDHDGGATAHGRKIDYMDNCKIMEMNNITKNICFISLYSKRKMKAHVRIARAFVSFLLFIPVQGTEKNPSYE